MTDTHDYPHYKNEMKNAHAHDYPHYKNEMK